MLDTPEQKSENEIDRPLVTFALFSYNQEEYIREAVEGAFAQTYEPLEIILSDDCSSDRTFEIMQEMAAAYKGPHEVTARQTPCNSGTLIHVSQVAKLAAGKLLILAAGDDVSKPNRSARIVKEWQRTSAWGICSDYSEIDAQGKMIAAHSSANSFDSPQYRLRQYMLGTDIDQPIILGATSAYDIVLFDELNLSAGDYILSEDGALSLLIHILGKKTVKIFEPLVDYRSHVASLTNAKGSSFLSIKQIHLAEENISRFNRSQANRCRFFINSHSRLLKEGTPSRLKIGLIKEDMGRHSLVSDWWNLSVIEKISGIVGTANRPSLAWAAPRILPKKLFLRIKYFSKFLRLTRFG